jgi:hypothetical protein
MALMNNATNQPPPPPGYPWECDLTNADAGLKIDAYLKTIFASEQDALTRLQSAAAQLALFGQDPGANAAKLAKKLIETDEVAQVDNLLSRYYYTNVGPPNPNHNADESKFMAIYELASNVKAADAPYGGKADTNWPAVLKAWSKDIRDSCVQQVHDGHVYSKAQAALNVESFRNNVMGVPPDLNASFRTALGKALTFQLTMDMTMTGNDDEATFKLDVMVQAHEDLTLSSSVGPPFTLNGSGTLAYLSGTWSEQFQAPDGSWLPSSSTLDSGQSCPVNPSLDLDPCLKDPKVHIQIPSLYNCQENWLDDNGNTTGAQWLPGAFDDIFALQSGDNWTPLSPGGSDFVFDLNDRQAEVVDETVEGQANPLYPEDLKIQFHLVHTPQ